MECRVGLHVAELTRQMQPISHVLEDALLGTTAFD